MWVAWFRAWALASLVFGLSSPAAAQVLYAESFDDGQAATRWTTSPSGNPNYAIDYAFDYGAAGIPMAPSGTSTIGLKMDANTSGSAVGAVLAFPNGQNFLGSYTLSFDLWLNVSGTVNTTEFGVFGVNHTSTVAQVPTSTSGTNPATGPSPNGIDFAMTGDAANSRDVRVYVAGIERTGTSGGYARNNLLIQEEQAAPYNFAYDPFVTSASAMPANQWLRVGVTAYSGTAIYSVNGQTWARTATVTGSGNIMLGTMDILANVAPPTVFGLYDNVTVSVAEPPASQLVWTPDGATAGGVGTWTNLGTQWIGSGTGLGGRATTWDWSLPGKFQGSAGTVTIPTQVTAGGGVEFLTDGYVVTSGTLIMGSFDPASGVSFNTNAISQVTVAAGASARIESVVRGAIGITKLGAGTLVLASANSLTGTTVVQAGMLELGNQSALGSSPTSVLSGGTLRIKPSVGMIGPQLILNGGTVAAADATLTVDRSIGVRQFIVNAGRLDGNPRLEVTLGGTMVMSSTAVTSVDVATLLVDQSATGGRIDLGVGRINITAGGITAANLVADILAGRSGTAGAWTGKTGITSSVAAATPQRAVGWIDGGATGLAVAFAAAGDTNIDGLCDILDIANFLSAGKYGTSEPATWSQGDFNYDGVVDVLDAGEFVSTNLYGAGSYLPAPAGSVPLAVVPEPAAAVVVGLAGVAVAVCRLRRRSGRSPPTARAGAGVAVVR